MKLRIPIRRGPQISANSVRIGIRANSSELEPASLLWTMDWLGSLSGYMDWGATISLKVCMGRDHLSLRRDYPSLGWRNPTWMCCHWTCNISLCAITLRAGSRSLHVTNMQIGNIDFTCPCVDGF